MSSNTSQNIQVTIELGHHASFKKKPSPEGYTHDWSVFVRGPEGSKIQHYVEKVVFQLHESFAKPKRVVKEPPYQVSESGYAGFNFPIIIYFRNKEIPKKYSFDYDLFLNVENSPPINNVRYEKLTFKNPNEEFRQKLLKAGGQPMGNPLALMEPSTGTVNKTDSLKKPPKSLSGSSKDGSSSKEKSKHKSSLNISGSSSKPSTPQSLPAPSKEIKPVTPSPIASAPKEHKSRGKEAHKRPLTSSPDGEQSGKKIKRSSSISSDVGKEKHSHKSEKSKHSKEFKDSSKKKSKHQSKSDKEEKKSKHSSDRSEKKEKSKDKSLKKVTDSVPLPADIPMRTELLSPLKDSSAEDDDDDDKTVKKNDSDSVSVLSSDLSSSSSSISLSPLPEAERKKNNSKFDDLMAELGDSDSSDDNFNVPIPILPPSPPQPKPIADTKASTSSDFKSPKKSKPSSSNHSKKSTLKPEKTKSKEMKLNKESKSKSSKSSSKNQLETSQNGLKEEHRGDAVALNGESISSLWALHDRIMASRDSDMLDEVVTLIQETGLFKITDTTFDFDLCSLDKETVQKISKCVSSVS